MRRIQLALDETNFSPSLCGDTLVAACTLLRQPPRGLLRDSKVTKESERLVAFAWLQEHSRYVIEIAGVNHIQHPQLGVYRARNQAMLRAAFGLLDLLAFDGIDWSECEVLIDGPRIPSVARGLGKVRTQFIVNGDALVPAISGASILAKVYTDALFYGWGQYWPGYGFEHDHGSPSQQHRRQLRIEGATPIHRMKHYAPDWWRRLRVRRSARMP